jgi:hypothetical protein
VSRVPSRDPRPVARCVCGARLRPGWTACGLCSAPMSRLPGRRVRLRVDAAGAPTGAPSERGPREVDNGDGTVSVFRDGWLIARVRK